MICALIHAKLLKTNFQNSNYYQQYYHDPDVAPQYIYEPYSPHQYRQQPKEVPRYNGCPHPHIFLEWMSCLEDFFEWHDFDDERCIRFVGWTLVGSAKSYWHKMLQAFNRLNHKLSWVEIKEKLEEKFFTPYYRRQRFPTLATSVLLGQVTSHVSQSYVHFVIQPCVCHVTYATTHYGQPKFVTEYKSQIAKNLADIRAQLDRINQHYQSMKTRTCDI